MFKRLLVGQAGVDTAQAVTVDLMLNPSLYQAAKIKSVEIRRATAALPVNGASRETIRLATTDATTETLLDADLVVMFDKYRVSEVTGAADALGVEDTIQRRVIDRLTVQPLLYASVSSLTTGQTLSYEMVVEFDVVVLKEIEYLRLSQGGA